MPAPAFQHSPFSPKAVAMAVSAAALGAQNAYAQQAIEEILVTATKREASVQDIPVSVLAFTDAEIVRRGFKQLEDYIGDVPGLSWGRREPGGTSVIMRGCAMSGLQFGSVPTTSIYLDEQPITAAGFNPDPRLIDIARVEALSGPQSTLFGDASLCGTLRIITNKPDTTAFDSWIDVTGTSVEDGDPGYDVSGMVNIPLFDNKVAVRLVGFYADEGGWIDNVLSQSPGGTFDDSAFVKKDINKSETTGGRVGVRWVPNDDWTIDLAGIYQKLDQKGYGDVDLNEIFYSGRNIGSEEQLRFEKESWTDKWYQVALTAEGSLGFADLMVTGSYFNRNTRYDADATAYQFAFQQVGDYLAYAYAGTPYFQNGIYDFGGDPQAFAYDDGKDERWTFEARLSTPADSTSRWSGLIGVFYNKIKGETLFASGNADFANSPAFSYLNYLAYYYNGQFVDGPTNNWFFGVYDSQIEQSAIFGEVTFEVTDRFSVTAGGRWFDVDTDRTLIQGGLLQNSDTRGGGVRPDLDGSELIVTNEKADTSDSDFVPKVTLTYQIQDDKMVYATYSEGFRRGGVNPARASSVFGEGQPDHNFDSDKIENYEIGAKTTWFAGSLQFNITGYHMDWKDAQIQANDPQPAVFALGFVNFPQAEIDGAEAFLSWIPAAGWELTGNVGYNDADISKTETLFPGSENPVTATNGTPLPLMPKWKASAGVQYTFERQFNPFNVGPVTPYVRADWNYVDDSVNSLEGIQSIIFDLGARTQSSYDILDLSAGVDAETWSASLFVNNVNDEEAELFYNDRWAQTRLTTNQPRTFGVHFRKYFN